MNLLGSVGPGWGLGFCISNELISNVLLLLEVHLRTSFMQLNPSSDFQSAGQEHDGGEMNFVGQQKHGHNRN